MDAVGLPGLPNNVEAVKRMTTKSVMSPVLWLIGITLPPMLLMAYFTSGWIQSLFAVLGAVEVIFGLGFFAYFAFKAPDRLQSEEYRIEEQRMTLLAEQGKPPVTLDLKAQQVSNTFFNTGEGPGDREAGFKT